MEYLLAAPTVQYCEAAIDMLIARPWYALSNVAFLIAGVVILLRGGRYSCIFGIGALAIGSLSFVYDASYTYLSQLLDLSGMLVFVGLLLYLNFRLLVRNKKALVTSFVVGFTAAVVAIILFKGFAGNFIFGSLVLGYVVSEVYLLSTKRHTGARYWALAFGVFVTGFMFWLSDATQLYCAEAGLLNGRSVFHYANAVTIYLLFRFYQRQHKG